MMFQQYMKELWQVLLELAPWLMFGMFVAGVLHVILPRGFVHLHFGKRGFRDVLKAAALGVPLPLCSCGVIPAAIGLKKDGASNGAATAFLISTPQTGVDSLMVSASFLGWPFAIYKVFSALAMGLVGGTIVNLSERNHPPIEPPLTAACGMNENGFAASWFAELFRFGFNRLLREIYRWIALGIVVAAAIDLFVPPDFFAGYPWMQGVGGMLVMLAIALPLYVCATASVPIAAALIHAGLPLGSALVFLTAGPASNVATIGAIYKTFGRRVTAIYLATVAVMSVALGAAFQWVLAGPDGGMAHAGHTHGLPFGIPVTAAVVLLALMGWFALSDAKAFALRMRAAKGKGEEHMKTLELKVEGMTCQNCVAHVKRALEGAKGVARAEVDLKSGRAVVNGEALVADALVAAVVKAGYQAAVARS